MAEKCLRLLHQTKGCITQGTAGAWTSCPSSLSSPQGNVELPGWVLCTQGTRSRQTLSLRKLALLKENILLANLLIVCSFLLRLAGSPHSNYKPILTRSLRIWEPADTSHKDQSPNKSIDDSVGRA